jgi:hypothetical protein
VYFISEVLSKSKVCYPSIQKLLYAILIRSRKLRRYFNEYQISVVTDFQTYSIMEMLLDASPSGKWNWGLSTLT